MENDFFKWKTYKTCYEADMMGWIAPCEVKVLSSVLLNTSAIKPSSRRLY